MVSQITRISSLLIFFIASTITIFGQCDEYYINELISGGDDQCYFQQGSPVRFCPRLKGMAINGATFDVMQWDGISTQYLTLTKNGGIAGTVVLKLNEKELLINLNGCGGARTYSISLTKSELEQWIMDKPKRDREKSDELLRQQEEIKNEKLKQDKIDSLITAHNLDNYFVTIDKSIVNEVIKNNDKFRRIVELSNKDTLIFEIKNSEISKINFDYNFNDYCRQLWDFMRSQEYENLTYAEQDSIDRISYFVCLREPRTHIGYTAYKIINFFPMINFRHDTLIDNIRIPLNNFKIVIIKNKNYRFEVKKIMAPEKFVNENLFICSTPFVDKYSWAGYFSNKKAENYTILETTAKIPISYTEEAGKDLIVSGFMYSNIYVDDIRINNEFIKEQNFFYKFKKLK